MLHGMPGMRVCFTVCQACACARPCCFLFSCFHHAQRSTTVRQHHIDFSDVDWRKGSKARPITKWFCLEPCARQKWLHHNAAGRTQLSARQDTADIDNSVPHTIFTLLEAATQLLALAVLISILEKFFLAGAVRGPCCLETYNGA